MMLALFDIKNVIILRIVSDIPSVEVNLVNTSYIDISA